MSFITQGPPPSLIAETMTEHILQSSWETWGLYTMYIIYNHESDSYWSNPGKSHFLCILHFTAAIWGVVASFTNDFKALLFQLQYFIENFLLPYSVDYCHASLYYFQPQFGLKFKIFEVDSCEGNGKVCLGKQKSMKIKWPIKGQSVVVSNDFISSPTGGKFEQYQRILCRDQEEIKF